MKIMAYITGLTLFAISVSVSAIPSVPPGVEDTLVRVGTVDPSSDAAESAFISEYLGWSDIWFYKVDGSAGADGGWFQDSVMSASTNSDLWAFDFGSVGVHHFLIKGPDGNILTYTDKDGNTFTGTHFLFENPGQFAVIDLNAFSRTLPNGKIKSVTIDFVSHIGAVPEPSIVALIGVGLLGMVFVHRRSRKRNMH